MKTSGALFLALSLLAYAAGQIFLKAAVRESRVRALVLAVAIAMLALSFFLDLGLLRHYELSFLYPFHALAVPMVAAGAAIFLRERTDLWLWCGIVVMTVGIALVNAS